jgi:hypothetical protein
MSHEMSTLHKENSYFAYSHFFAKYASSLLAVVSRFSVSVSLFTLILLIYCNCISVPIIFWINRCWLSLAVWYLSSQYFFSQLLLQWCLGSVFKMAVGILFHCIQILLSPSPRPSYQHACPLTKSSYSIAFAVAISASPTLSLDSISTACTSIIVSSHSIAHSIEEESSKRTIKWPMDGGGRTEGILGVLLRNTCVYFCYLFFSKVKDAESGDNSLVSPRYAEESYGPVFCWLFSSFLNTYSSQVGDGRVPREPLFAPSFLVDFSFLVAECFTSSSRFLFVPDLQFV